MGELEHAKHLGAGARWDDAIFWERISVGRCSLCDETHVLKDRLCWDCRPERKA